MSEEKHPKDPGKENPVKPYPSKDDIYNRAEKEGDIDPDDLSKTKSPNEKPGKKNEKTFEEDMTGEDLDIPGNEPDEEAQGNGEEDEENNYYSLGGDKEK